LPCYQQDSTRQAGGVVSLAKILAKIKRRHNSNELPDRRELVEMDLFDTDRNPWPGKGGSGGLWERHDYDVGVPYSPPHGGGGVPDPAPALVGPLDLVVERPSFAIAFLGAKGNIVSGGVGEYHTFYLFLRATKGDEIGIDAFVEAPFEANGPFHASNWGSSNSPQLTVLAPGTYQVEFFSWWWKTDGASTPVISVTKVAATIGLIPAGLLGYAHLIGT
jgi:hypothetical protein